MGRVHPGWFFFFFNDTATTEIYTLSLHDALPISSWPSPSWVRSSNAPAFSSSSTADARAFMFSVLSSARSEEHTSELQSLAYLVCRLLLEKKKKTTPAQLDVLEELITCPDQDGGL